MHTYTDIDVFKVDLGVKNVYINQPTTSFAPGRLRLHFSIEAGEL
jgi:hypothetical protein